MSSCDAEYEKADAAVRDHKLLDDDQRERQVIQDIETSLKSPDKAACWKSPWEKHRDYDLFSVEFDDQGWAADSFNDPDKKETQLKTLVNGLKKIYEGQGQKQPLNIVIYTHGWHHSARPADSNVVRFRTLLEGLSLAEGLLCVKRAGAACLSDQAQLKPIDKRRRVVGVYLGWRGDSILGPLIEDLSIWDRKTVAEKVAHGAIQELYSHMNDFYRERNCRSRNLSGKDLEKCADVRMLTIGHSFGGLITLRALSSRLMAGVVETYDKQPCAEGSPNTKIRYANGIGNLTLLINPAVEGTRFEPLARAVAQREYQAPDMDSPCKRSAQLPVLVIAQSKGDLATKLAFPAFRMATTLFEDTHGYGTAESKANISTVGWTKRYQTHDLVLSDTEDECKTLNTGDVTLVKRLTAESEWAEKKINAGFAGFDGNIAFCERIQMNRVAADTAPDALHHPGYSPVWTMLTDKSIIEDHNDLLNANFVRFVRQLYYLILREEDFYQKNQIEAAKVN
jgi:hypothetical protein